MRLHVYSLLDNTGHETREQARRLGAAAFFRIPIDDQALLDTIWWAISGLQKNKE